MKYSKNWEYNGDVNIEHGGYFINYENLQYGYCDVIRISSIDDISVYLIEELTVNIPDDMSEIKDALNYCGFDLIDNHTIDSNGLIINFYQPEFIKIIMDCLVHYGSYDIHNSEPMIIPDYCLIDNEDIKTLRKESKNKGYCSIDGFRVDSVKNSGFNLENYVIKNYLGGY